MHQFFNQAFIKKAHPGDGPSVYKTALVTHAIKIKFKQKRKKMTIAQFVNIRLYRFINC